MKTYNHNRMADTFWENLIMYTMVAYTLGMNFITVSPPPVYIDTWLQVFLHVSQIIAATIAIILGIHTCYEKFWHKIVGFFKKKESDK